MKNIEKIQSMGVDELSEWLTSQIWPEYGKHHNADYIIRYNVVRNFLISDYKEGD